MIGRVHFKPEHFDFWSNFEFDWNIVSGMGTKLQCLSFKRSRYSGFCVETRVSVSCHCIAKEEPPLFTCSIVKEIRHLFSTQVCSNIVIIQTCMTNKNGSSFFLSVLIMLALKIHLLLTATRGHNYTSFLDNRFSGPEKKKSSIQVLWSLLIVHKADIDGFIIIVLSGRLCHHTNDVFTCFV